MKSTLWWGSGLHSLLLAVVTSALTIPEINGPSFLSPYSGESVSNVTGIVTAKSEDGIYIRAPRPDNDVRTSNSIYVYSSTVGTNLTVGDLIVLGGEVQEYRSSDDYLYLTEIGSPSDVRVISSGNDVESLVIGHDTLTPPIIQYTSLDDGDVFGVPNAQSRISEENPELQPDRYGLDFWESLSGELVKVQGPNAVSRPNQYGDTWVIGDWQVRGRNLRGSLTIRNKDANPEAIIIGSPLDGSSNPDDTKLGDKLEDITGVLTYAFGFYRILPLTSLNVTSSAQPAQPPATSLESDGTCARVTFAQYNVENLTPDSDHMSGVADHIANFLKNPDVIFLQEVQDNDGATDDGVVDANATLSALSEAIASAGNVTYAYVDIDPENDEDGGEPGGNIRNAYLYNPDHIRLRDPNPGGPDDATEVLPGARLSYNPGRIAPADDAWEDSRKPIVAVFETVTGGHHFFAVNAHFASKGGSSSLHGDPRPPVNGGVDQRTRQARVTGQFIADILAERPRAAVVAAGDFNEFAFVEPMETLRSVSGMRDLDEVAGIAEKERYTYLYDMNSQELDHVYLSHYLAQQSPKFEHIHLNTWVSYDDQVSDHDPSVGRLNICGLA